MARVLNSTTVLRDPRNGRVVVLHEGTEVPEWAEDLVGDHLTAGGNPAGGEETPQDPGATPADDPGDDGGTEGDEAPSEPPRAGRGSGVEAWKAYAAAIGIDVPDDATRDTIVELVDEHQPK